MDTFRKYISCKMDINETDKLGRNILMFAAHNSYIDMFEYLVINHESLITLKDSDQSNIMHYLARSETNNPSMIDIITSKKFKYSKLIWMRNINGELAKDIAIKYGNQKILKKIENIMCDTCYEYAHFARNNHSKNTKNTNINSTCNHSSDIDDDDDDDIDIVGVIAISDHKLQNDTNVMQKKQSLHRRRKRKLSELEITEYVCLRKQIIKKAKLNSIKLVPIMNKEKSPSPLLLSHHHTSIVGNLTSSIDGALTGFSLQSSTMITCTTNMSQKRCSFYHGIDANDMDQFNQKMFDMKLQKNNGHVTAK